jgi:hypothetical protein
MNKVLAPQKSPLPVSEKAPEQSGSANVVKGRASVPSRLVWGPGAGVEAAGRLCLGHNLTGVASIPQLAAKLRGR